MIFTHVGIQIEVQIVLLVALGSARHCHQSVHLMAVKDIQTAIITGINMIAMEIKDVLQKLYELPIQ